MQSLPEWKDMGDRWGDIYIQLQEKVGEERLGRWSRKKKDKRDKRDSKWHVTSGTVTPEDVVADEVGKASESRDGGVLRVMLKSLTLRIMGII